MQLGERTTVASIFHATGRFFEERRSMTEEKTVRELREEIGLSIEELAEGMRISERDLMKLEHSGQKYYGLDREWFALLAEPYFYNKVFWYPPEKAIGEWERAIGILEAFAVMAEKLDSEPLIAILGDATARAWLEHDGCRELLYNPSCPLVRQTISSRAEGRSTFSEPGGHRGRYHNHHLSTACATSSRRP
ncbi:MAG: helix-turn-helix transcriptional regulator, partial [Rubrobacter sp.]|nr:helix-turn-helix transcriptional regulator [Rubrobacter sp.]